MKTYVVIAAPISTTNITGLRAIHMGLSFLTLSQVAGPRMAGSYRLLWLRRLRVRGTPPALGINVMTARSYG